MIKAIFFDLDGTLLPMDEREFVKIYFYSLSEKLRQYNYEQKQLIDTIIKGTELMYRNVGPLSNEEVFFSYFKSVYGEEKLQDKKYFDEYYLNEFLTTKNACGENPFAKEIVNFCKDNFEKVILSTNPIFPLIATKKRMGFVGLFMDDFDYVTSYENCCNCKPNPQYFIDLLEKFNLKPEEVILFGNNTYEDGECALKAGIRCILVGETLINHPKSTHEFEHIKIEEVIPLLQNILRIENK